MGVWLRTGSPSLQVLSRIRSPWAIWSASRPKDFNREVLKSLPLEEHVVPGEVRGLAPPELVDERDGDEALLLADGHDRRGSQEEGAQDLSTASNRKLHLFSSAGARWRSANGED
jgi:hypothetical protein